MLAVSPACRVTAAGSKWSSVVAGETAETGVGMLPAGSEVEEVAGIGSSLPGGNLG